MPFNNELFDSPATRGDVAGVAIRVSIALDAILICLEGLKTGGTAADISSALAEIRRRSAELNKEFDELTGWTKPPAA